MTNTNQERHEYLACEECAVRFEQVYKPQGFSWRHCDICKSPLGGDKYLVVDTCGEVDAYWKSLVE